MKSAHLILAKDELLRDPAPHADVDPRAHLLAGDAVLVLEGYHAHHAQGMASRHYGGLVDGGGTCSRSDGGPGFGDVRHPRGLVVGLETRTGLSGMYGRVGGVVWARATWHSSTERKGDSGIKERQNSAAFVRG